MICEVVDVMDVMASVFTCIARDVLKYRPK
jgi:hypothetical protein